MIYPACPLAPLLTRSAYTQSITKSEQDFGLVPCDERLLTVLGDGLLQIADVLHVLGSVNELLDGVAIYEKATF